VALDSASAWTIKSVDYRGDRSIIPSGGQGAVLSLPKIGWVGSVMGKERKERVTAFSVKVGEEEQRVSGTSTVSGESVTMRKASELGPFRHEAETAIEGDVIRQRHTFEAQKDGRLGVFYAFIYSFTPKGQAWLARSGDQTLRGEFSGDRGRRPGTLCDWLAQYDPATEKGTVIYFATPVKGAGAVTAFWDTKGYHKLLFQPPVKAVKKGDAFDFTLVMRFFSAAPDAWEKRATEIAAALQASRPQEKTEMPEQERVYGEGVPEAGMLTVKTQHYTVRFEAKRAWTIFDMAYDDKRFGISNGFYGTVMVPKGSRWWGTGHTEGGREIVHALKLTVDGEERPVRAGATVEGPSVTLVKESTIWKFKAHVEVRVGDDHVYERTRLTAFEDTELGILYYFMHRFPPTTTQWMAELPDGSTETGELTRAGDMKVTQDTRWVAQFEPEMKLGILCYTPRVITGPKSESKIWDKKNYHKYYLQQNRGQAFKAGEEMDYAVAVKAVPNETGDWAATKEAAAELKETYPPVDE